MSVSNTPINIPKKAQEGVIEFYKQCSQMASQNWNIKDQMRAIDLKYIRETDLTQEQSRAKQANKNGDPNRFQNVTVPVVMPQVESAVTYQTSVFLTGNPIFGVVASPRFEDEALQMETVIDENSVRGGWVRELILAFRDGFKYNFFALEATWDRQVTAALETDTSFSAKLAKPKEIIWEGNCIRRLDPYNLAWDTRVPVTEVHKKGEFVSYTDFMSRIALKAFINTLADKMVENIVPAFESEVGFCGPNLGGIGDSYYIPQINPDALLQTNLNTGTDWMAWAGLTQANNNAKIDYRNSYEVTTLYGRILPSDFGIKVPSANTPQVWKFIIVNHQIIIYAERLTNAHGYIPVLFGQPLEDGLSYQTKSLAQNVAPIQDVTTAMMNSLIASRRRAISDRTLYDPSRISEAAINSDNPSAKIPVRPAAYGKPVGEAVYQFPFRDDQAPVLTQQIQFLNQYANLITGQNQVRQGQFVKGNKTLHEFADVMQHANGRDQMTSMLLESQLFTPLKEIIKLNILQYQGGVSLFNRNKQENVTIDPVALRKAVLEFKISDGLLPTDKLISSDTLGMTLQVIGSSPQIAAEYNVGPLFSYLIKTQGGNIGEFEKSKEQIAYEQAMAQWQQAVSTIAAELKGADSVLVQQVMKQLPPQPKPQDYGYNPTGAASSNSAPSIQTNS